jgi:hypothetical protein
VTTAAKVDCLDSALARVAQENVLLSADSSHNVPLVLDHNVRSDGTSSVEARRASAR